MHAGAWRAVRGEQCTNARTCILLSSALNLVFLRNQAREQLVEVFYCWPVCKVWAFFGPANLAGPRGGDADY